MKPVFKILLFLLLASFISCCSSNMAYERDTNQVNKMEPPIVVIGISKNIYNEKGNIKYYGSLTLRDANGTLKEFSGRYSFAASIIDSREVGDTIVYKRKK